MSGLFRKEVIAQQSERLSGDVIVAVPLAWRNVGYLIFGSVVAGILFLSFASYSRIENVAGAIVPDSGVAQIVPTRSGVIAGIDVRDGQRVEKGAALATVRAEEDSARGLSSAAQIEASIVQQDSSLASQAIAAQSAAIAQQSQLAAQRSGLAAEIGQIEAQISLQRELVSSAQRDLDRARTIAERGFISGRDLQVREETLLSRQQGLSQLTQSLASRRSALTEAGRNAEQVAAQARAQSSNLAASRAQVAQQAASASGARSYVLRAPVAGQVTALTARLGQPANPQSPIMTIVPAGSSLRAELAIPSSAIGFVKPGQEVRLAIDAFPYQRFGTVPGKVVTVATSAISQRGPNDSVIAVYPVVVALEKTRVTAFGRDEALLPGMTLSARIVTEKQSLLQWLFEPLFAVRRR
jgi:membrane fusion protein